MLELSPSETRVGANPQPSAAGPPPCAQPAPKRSRHRVAPLCFTRRAGGAGLASAGHGAARAEGSVTPGKKKTPKPCRGNRGLSVFNTIFCKRVGNRSGGLCRGCAGAARGTSRGSPCYGRAKGRLVPASPAREPNPSGGTSPPRFPLQGQTSPWLETGVRKRRALGWMKGAEKAGVAGSLLLCSAVFREDEDLQRLRFPTSWYFPWLQLRVAFPVPTGAGHWGAGSGPGTPRAAGRAAIFQPSVRVSIVWGGDGAVGVWAPPCRGSSRLP